MNKIKIGNKVYLYGEQLTYSCPRAVLLILKLKSSMIMTAVVIPMIDAFINGIRLKFVGIRLAKVKT